MLKPPEWDTKWNWIDKTIYVVGLLLLFTLIYIGGAEMHETLWEWFG